MTKKEYTSTSLSELEDFKEAYSKSLDERTDSPLKAAAIEVSVLVASLVKICKENNFNLGIFFDPKINDIGMLSTALATGNTNTNIGSDPHLIPLYLKELFNAEPTSKELIYMIRELMDIKNERNSPDSEEQQLCDCPDCVADRATNANQNIVH